VALFEATHERTRRALHCAFENRITVYDALFLSLAQEFDCPLITADRTAFGAIPPEVAEVRLVL
jgi:predicted nucleic acid-binding protein